MAIGKFIYYGIQTAKTSNLRSFFHSSALIIHCLQKTRQGGLHNLDVSQCQSFKSSVSLPNPASITNLNLTDFCVGVLEAISILWRGEVEQVRHWKHRYLHTTEEGIGSKYKCRDYFTEEI
jgi:hypothetical protein